MPACFACYDKFGPGCASHAAHTTNDSSQQHHHIVSHCCRSRVCLAQPLVLAHLLWQQQHNTSLRSAFRGRGTYCAAAPAAAAAAAVAAALLSSLHSALCHFQCSTWQALQQYLQGGSSSNQQGVKCNDGLCTIGAYLSFQDICTDSAAGESKA
jgi:hypothetical protein